MACDPDNTANDYTNYDAEYKSVFLEGFFCVTTRHVVLKRSTNNLPSELKTNYMQLQLKRSVPQRRRTKKKIFKKI